MTDTALPAASVARTSSAAVFISCGLSWFVFTVGLLGLAAYVWLYATGHAETPIRSDGYSYYVYLPSVLLHGDPSLEAVADDCCGGTYPEFTAIIRWPATNRWVDAHPIGVAVMQLPAFAIAHALTRWSNLPPDGFSLYYQHAAGLAGLAYLLAGLAVLRRLLREHFSQGVTLATLAALTFGTNLFHYGVYDSTFSHAYSFFLIAALVLVADRWWETPSTARSVLLGIVSGLIVLTRHPNVIFLLIVALYGIRSTAALRARIGELVQRRQPLAIAVAVSLACVLPQLWLYHRATGHWIVSSYGALGFTWRSPHLWDVLFSVRKGLFFWSPLLLFSVAGIAVARGWPAGLGAGSVLVLAIDTYVIASWWDWQYGGSFGHRGFTDALALFGIFLAAFYAWAAARPRLLPVVAGASVAATALSVAQMFQYWLRILPFSDITWQQYRTLFLRFP